MRPLRPIATAIVVGAALYGCATTPTNTNQPAPRPDEPPAQAAATPAPTPAPASTIPDIRKTCPKDVQRQIDCVDEFLPMVVATRIKLDFPQGIAERGKDEAGRKELVGIAMQEFPQYYSVDKIPAICAKREAMVEKMPQQMLEELAAIGAGCLYEEDCQGFTRCTAPVLEKILAWQADAVRAGSDG